MRDRNVRPAARLACVPGRAAALGLVGVIFWGACGGKEPAAAPPTPHVKVEVVGERARQLTRQISGRLESVNEAALSFGVGGTVEAVLVDAGAAVSKGQLLARLDADEFEARAQSAASRLRAAKANLEERLQNLRRQEALLAEELVARAAVERLRAGVEKARGELRAAESDRVRADLELRQTRIVAPIAGSITSRNVEPFAEVMANETLFDLAGEGGLQAVVLVPESLVRDVYYGQAAVVRVPSTDQGELPGTVGEIAAVAGEGNAFRVAIRLADTSLDLRPGMTANATFAFAGKFAEQPAFLIPLSALALRKMAVEDRPRGQGDVFVFDEKSSTVQQRQVTGSDAVGNRIAIAEGLEVGDRVVVAGVAFLHDGQRVELWEPPE